MKRIPFLLSFALAACSSVDDRPACSASTDCAAGQYCARTADGNVCWADRVAPTVSSVVVTCDATPCRRDGVLHVVASVSDDKEVLDVTAALDLAPTPTVRMTRSGSSWVADVPLRSFPFDAFERPVTATVTARDGARNESVPLADAPLLVTRLKWTYDATVPMTAAAVMADGTAVVGLSSNSEQLLAIREDGTKAWGLNVGGTAFVTAAPAIGERAIWVGSEDFSLYGVKLDGSGVLAGVGIDTFGGVKGSVAMLAGATKEWAFATSSSGRVGAASTPTDAPKDALTFAGDAYTTGPVVGLDGRIYAATATATATLQAFSFDGGFTRNWTASVGVNVSAPLAVDGAGNVWTGSQDARLVQTTPGETSGSATTVATLPGSIVDSPVILAGGDVVVGDQSGLLHRYSSTGAQLWTAEPNLGGAVLAPIVLSDGPATLLVPTKTGVLYALDGSGNEVWHTTLGTGAELRSGNIFTPTNQPAGRILSTAYFPASSGKLYAVIVDGKLDASAPWPKAFHDPRNTNRAGPQP